MLNKILWDVLICLALCGPLIRQNWFLVNLSNMAVVFVGICTVVAVLAVFAITGIRSKGKKAFNRKELERCKSFFRFKVYEPLSDICIAFSLAAVGHYIIGVIYFMVGSLIR